METTTRQKTAIPEGKKISDLLDVVTLLLRKVVDLQDSLGNGNPIGNIYIPREQAMKIGYSFYVLRTLEGKSEAEWVPYAIGRMFDTGHIGYVMGNLDVSQILAHDPKQTIHFLLWLKDLLRDCLPKAPK